MDKLMVILDALATKLDTTAEQVIPHYIQYVWACGLIGVIAGVFLLFVCTPICAYVAYRGFKGMDESTRRASETHTAMSVIGISVGLSCFIGGALAFVFNAGAMLAPEGYAVAELLTALK